MYFYSEHGNPADHIFREQAGNMSLQMFKGIAGAPI